MRDRPSFTAAWVATCRSLGALLPEPARLCDDRYGAAFGGPGLRALGQLLEAAPRSIQRTAVTAGPLAAFVGYMQVRTRVLDDVLLGFVRGGGRQVVLLGAGFDCRAHRFAPQLAGATVFEVDHPATQARKRRLVAERRAPGAPCYLPWDFERNDMAALAGALADRGHEPARPTLTIWEGVTMYLGRDAIDATLAAVRAWSQPGSLLALTYLDRHTPPPRYAALLSLLGEPYRFGWAPDELVTHMAAYGFAVELDRTEAEAAAALLPEAFVHLAAPRGRHLAVVRRT